MSGRFWRVPFPVVALLSMTWGIWMGLLRLGWVLPLPWPDQLILHGPLMVGGFLGTLVGLERASGLAKPWAYAAPICSASAAVLLVFGPPGPGGPLLMTLGSVVVVIVFLVLLRRQPSLFTFTMLIGAVGWFVGNALWCAGAAIYRVVFWWVVFLVLTIAGERLELNRVLQPAPSVRKTFLLAVSLCVAGVVGLSAWPAAGARVAGAGLLALTAWLGRNDVARRTIRQRGLTRYMAACLLAGYAWLGIGGLLLLVTAETSPGTTYDAILHAVFVGFVVSMVFGHAPIVLPAIMGTPVPYSPAFYGHLALLHVSVAVRLAADLVEPIARYRAWGGLFNALALALFIGDTVGSLVWGRLSTGRAAPPGAR